MSHQKIKAVLFDLGETLLTFGKIDTVGAFREGARLSYDFLKEQGQTMGNFEWYYWQNLLSLQWRHFLSKFTGNDFNSLSLMMKAGAKKGINLSEDQWLGVAWRWYEPLNKIGEAETDIVQTLSTLKEQGVKLGILSNTFIPAYCLERHLEQFDMLRFFEARLYSYQFNFHKPDVRIFRTAAERIGERMENILFVGDRIDKDIRPSLAAGMKAALKSAYTNSDKPLPEGAWKIDQLSELPDVVEKYNAGCE